MATVIEVDNKTLHASLRHAVLTLQLIDPKLVKAAQKSMKKAAELIVQDARSRIPDVPTGVSSTGRRNWMRWEGSSDRTWNSGLARSGIKAQYRKPRKERPGERPIVSVIQWDPAGAVYDMAGRNGRYIQNPTIARAFIGALDRTSTKGASRTMWPAAEAKMSEVLAAMDAARVEMESEINSRLGGFGSSLAGF